MYVNYLEYQDSKNTYQKAPDISQFPSRNLNTQPARKHRLSRSYTMAEIGWSWLREDFRFAISLILLHQTQACAQEPEPHDFCGKNSVSPEFFPGDPPLTEEPENSGLEIETSGDTKKYDFFDWLSVKQSLSGSRSYRKSSKKDIYFHWLWLISGSQQKGKEEGERFWRKIWIFFLLHLCHV